MRAAGALAALCVAACASAVLAEQPNPDAYLSWTAGQAETVGRETYRKGRVAGGRALLNTERAFSYKIAATWLTPDVIRAGARLLQLSNRLSVSETDVLVKEAEAVAATVIMVEIDPDEGSGVIPNGWQAFLQSKGRPETAVRGTLSPQLREMKALAGVIGRNYAYDRFWVTFPLTGPNGGRLFSANDQSAELVVHIYEREGRVEWPIPASLR